MAAATVVIAVVAGLAVLLAAALHDVAFRWVPNRMAAAVALCGLVAQVAGGGLLLALPCALGVFVFMALLWRRGWIGGGDVKLLGATALLVPTGAIPALIAATALAGGVLALPYALARRRLARPAFPAPQGRVARALRAERWRLARGGPMPYAVAIACGAVFVAAPLLAPFAEGLLP